MQGIYKLKNTIQEYSWGSKTAIAEILGTESPSDKPQAELWMGAHPKAPSIVDYDGERITLNDLIDRFPNGILGEEVVRKFEGNLPFLFKILAADKPLSIQAHPNKAQAIEGFAKEEESGISIHSPSRNYKDENHKPEIICALTEFHALNGFRRIDEIIGFFKALVPNELKAEIDSLTNNPTGAELKEFFQSLMTIQIERKERAIAEIINEARKRRDECPEYDWILRLHDEHPHDIGILAPVYLNYVLLKPDEAMYLDAGDLHAYLHGVGIELMANSDNVLRGGLTPKHVDVPELLRIVNFKEKKLEILKPVPRAVCEKFYETIADEFELSVIEPSEGKIYVCDDRHGIEILIVIDGTVLVSCKSNIAVELTKGESAVIPSLAGQYEIIGNGRLYKAGIPNQ